MRIILFLFAVLAIFARNAAADDDTGTCTSPPVEHNTELLKKIDSLEKEIVSLKSKRAKVISPTEKSESYFSLHQLGTVLHNTKNIACSAVHVTFKGIKNLIGEENVLKAESVAQKYWSHGEPHYKNAKKAIETSNKNIFKPFFESIGVCKFMKETVKPLIFSTYEKFESSINPHLDVVFNALTAEKPSLGKILPTSFMDRILSFSLFVIIIRFVLCAFCCVLSGLKKTCKLVCCCNKSCSKNKNKKNSNQPKKPVQPAKPYLPNAAVGKGKAGSKKMN